MDPRQKAKREQLMVLILGVLLLAVLLRALSQLGILGGKPKTPVAKPSAQAPTVPQAVHQFQERLETAEQRTAASRRESQPEDQPMGEVVRYTAESVRDPMVSLLPHETVEQPEAMAQESAPPVAPLPEMLVQGMIWGSPRPQAVINGEVYDVGDTIDSAKIMAIGKEGVTVDVEGTTFRVTTRAPSHGLGNWQSGYTPGWTDPSMNPSVTTPSYMGGEP